MDSPHDQHAHGRLLRFDITHPERSPLHGASRRGLQFDGLTQIAFQVRQTCSKFGTGHGCLDTLDRHQRSQQQGLEARHRHGREFTRRVKV